MSLIKPPEVHPEPRTQVYPPDFYEDYQPVSLLHYVNILLRHRWLIVVCFLLAAVGAYVNSKLTDPVYEATSKFITDPKAASRVLSTGEVYGIETRNPVDYLSSVAKSAPVLDRVLAHKFQSQGNAPLLDLLQMPALPGETPESRQLRAREFFKGDVVTLAASSPRDVTVINIKAQWKTAEMAAELANAFTDELIAYDRLIKSAVARSKREFIEKQVVDTEKLLRKAEDDVRDFTMRNRQLYMQVASNPVGGGGFINVSPELRLEKDRRDREVGVQSNLFLTLKRELELAKIGETNDASTIVVVERATPPLRRIKPNTRTNVMLAAVVGLMLGIGLAFILEYAAAADTDSPDTREFLGHLSSLRGDLFKLLSIFSLGLISSSHEKTPSSN